jgi:hypothetical protein
LSRFVGIFAPGFSHGGLAFEQNLMIDPPTRNQNGRIPNDFDDQIVDRSPHLSQFRKSFFLETSTSGRSSSKQMFHQQLAVAPLRSMFCEACFAGQHCSRETQFLCHQRSTVVWLDSFLD